MCTIHQRIDDNNRLPYAAQMIYISLTVILSTSGHGLIQSSSFRLLMDHGMYKSHADHLERHPYISRVKSDHEYMSNSVPKHVAKTETIRRASRYPQDPLKDPKISKSIDWDLGRIALWIEILKPPQPDASIKSQYQDGIDQEPLPGRYRPRASN